MTMFQSDVSSINLATSCYKVWLMFVANIWEDKRCCLLSNFCCLWFNKGFLTKQYQYRAIASMSNDRIIPTPSLVWKKLHTGGLPCMLLLIWVRNDHVYGYISNCSAMLCNHYEVDTACLHLLLRRHAGWHFIYTITIISSTVCIRFRHQCCCYDCNEVKVLITRSWDGDILILFVMYGQYMSWLVWFVDQDGHILVGLVRRTKDFKRNP